MKKYFLILLLVIGLFHINIYAQKTEDLWAVVELNNSSISNETQKEVQEPQICSIVARDDRMEITGKAKDSEKAVVVLEMTNDSGRRGLCSGSMVGPNIVLTAAHCITEYGRFMRSVQVFAVGMPSDISHNISHKKQTIKQKPGIPLDDIISEINKRKNNLKDNSSSIFMDEIEQIIKDKVNKNNFEQTSTLDDILNNLHNGFYPSAKATKLWVPKEYIKLTQNKHNNSVDLDKEEIYDYGILILDNPIGNKTGWLGLTVKSEQQLKNAQITVIGRSGDKPARSLWKADGRISEVYDHYFFHNADIIGGNSGGPIFDKKDPSKIIALANFGNSQKYVSDGYPNGGLRINKHIINIVNNYKK